MTRGGGPYACLRIGLASRLPAMPDEGRREGSLVKSAAAWTTSSGSAAPFFVFRASRPASEASRAERQWSPAVPAESAARAAPRGRLEGVQRVCTEQAPAHLTAFNSLPLLFRSDHLKRLGWPPCRVGASQRTGPPLHPQGHPKILSNRSAESILGPTLARGASASSGAVIEGRRDLPRLGARPPPFSQAVRLACTR